jgi:hypothetical protein
MMNPAVRPSAGEPVTVAVTWHIRPGQEQAFEAWLAGVTAAALAFPGHLGVNVLRPAGPGRPFVLIFRFATYEQLRAWEQSPERASWLARSLPLRARAPEAQMVSGLEFWFTPPAGAAPPPRWKMVVVTCLALYPLANLLGLLWGPLLAGHAPWLATLLTIPATMVLMTYVVMPLATHLCGGWLYPSLGVGLER